MIDRFINGRWMSRSTVFAMFFAVTAFVLAIKGLLTNQYVAVITALHVTVTSRAIAEDHFECQKKESSNINQNLTN